MRGHEKRPGATSPALLQHYPLSTVPALTTWVTRMPTIPTSSEATPLIITPAASPRRGGECGGHSGGHEHHY